MEPNFRKTTLACYLGYVTQAIIINLAPLLFVTFINEFDISLSKLSLLMAANFGTQIVTDALSFSLSKRFGYRTCVVASHIFCAAGLIGLSTFPYFLPPYFGIFLATILYAVGGALIEVLISPIIEATPSKNKAASMSLLHSFYCWGQAFVVLLSTLYFSFFHTQSWQMLPVFWSIIPIINIILFSNTPIVTLEEKHETVSLKELLHIRLVLVLILLMMTAGACEIAMSQWASAFAEAGLHVSKSTGDLLGPFLFAILMGIARTFFGKFGDKIPLKKALLTSAFLCILCYILTVFSTSPILSLLGCAFTGLSVGIMWPGVISLGAGACPQGGTLLFAIMALFGDFGCILGSNLVGIAADLSGKGLRFGLFIAMIFPILMLLTLLLFDRKSFREKRSDRT